MSQSESLPYGPGSAINYASTLSNDDLQPTSDQDTMENNTLIEHQMSIFKII